MNYGTVLYIVIIYSKKVTRDKLTDPSNKFNII